MSAFLPPAQRAHAFAGGGLFKEAAACGRDALIESLGNTLDPVFLEHVCYWHINAGQTHILMRDLLPIVRLRMQAQIPPPEREARRNAIYNIGQELLEKGARREALAFLQLADSVDSTEVTRHAALLFETVDRLINEAELLAPAIAAPHATSRFVISSVVWGDLYIDNYLRYLWRSLLAPGNLPFLYGAPVYFSILTTEAGRERILASPIYERILHYCSMNFFIFPDELTKLGTHVEPNFSFYQTYGALDHVSIFFARALDASIFFIPVDAIMARGSIKSIVHFIENGYDAVGVTNMVATRETFLPAIDEKFNDSIEIDISPRELADLGFKHRHQYTRAALMVEDNHDFAEWPRDLFYPRPGGLEVRAIFLHPLCVSNRAIKSDVTFNYKIVDFQLPPSLFPRPEDFSRFKVIPNAGEVYMTDSTTEPRRFHTTGKPFDPQLFAQRNTHSKALHRWFIKQKQFIPCDHGLKPYRDPDADVEEVLAHLQELAPLPA